MADKPPIPPSAWELERAVSTWQQLRALYASDAGLADDEEVIRSALADADISHPEMLLERAIDAVIWCDRRSDEADQLRRDMMARRDRYRVRAELIRAMIDQLMTALGTKSHRAKLGAASLAMGKPSVVLIDADAVPDEFVRTERHILRTPIHEAIDAGRQVPGAALSNPAPVLTIRKL